MTYTVGEIRRGRCALRMRVKYANESSAWAQSEDGTVGEWWFHFEPKRPLLEVAPEHQARVTAGAPWL